MNLRALLHRPLENTPPRRQDYQHLYPIASYYCSFIAYKKFQNVTGFVEKVRFLEKSMKEQSHDMENFLEFVILLAGHSGQRVAGVEKDSMYCGVMDSLHVCKRRGTFFFIERHLGYLNFLLKAFGEIQHDS